MPGRRGYSLTTGAAFVALIALIFGLALNGLLQLQTLGDQMQMVVEQHNRKIDLITQTQVASHTRTDSLFRMALAEDPFERDAHFLEFNRAGFLVGSGRNALRRMGFSTAEQRSFDAQTQLVNDIEAVQERVVDLLSAERSAVARQVLVMEAIPIQEAFNRQLADMRSLYQQANAVAQRQAEHTYRQTFLLTLAFGIAAIVLALWIAWHTLRKIGRTSNSSARGRRCAKRRRTIR
jgi:Four helix bundle sensory module for signal transduction